MAKSPALKNLTKAILRANCNNESPAAPADPGRRDALKTLVTGAGLVAGAMIPAPARQLARSVWAASNTPVVVIGGGLAGLSAAYTLVKRGIPCELYEATPRTGGRVFTYDKFNAEGMFCELGGEFVDSSNTELLTLAHELGLLTSDWRPSDRGLKRHEFFIGGKHHYDEDLAAVAGPLARRLRADALEAFPNKVGPTYRKFTPAAEKLDRMSLAEYLASIKDLEPWAREAVNAAYLTEYGLDTDQQSALNILVMLDSEPGPKFNVFGSSDEAMRIRGGNSRLPEALERFIKKRGKLISNQRLVKIADRGGSLALTFQGAGPTREVVASQVICAIPFATLRNVEGIDKLGLSPVKLKMIRELGYGTNAKFVYGFRERPWRKPHGGQPATSGYGFTDRFLQTYWDSSREQKGKSAVVCHFPGGKAATETVADRLGSTMTELEQIYPGVKALYDGNQMSWTWASYPFALGSYTCMKPGQWTTLMGAAGEPELGGRLLFAGEHVSEKNQGYMNGAVETGLAAARQALAARTLRTSSKL